MDTKVNLADLEVIILCGGLGTRIKPALRDDPKVLAKIRDKTFLDILLEELISQGFENFIFCVGYLKEQIKKHHFQVSKKISIAFSEEEQPLGTGGAIKNASKLIKSNPFLVINGDSFCKLDYLSLLNFHSVKKSIMTMVLTLPGTRDDGGNVHLNPSKRILKFNEKGDKEKKTLLNAGIYMMQNNVFKLMPDKKNFSLEYDLFPKLVNFKIHGFLTESELLDVGTPERYAKALQIL